jgi:hypothetical protein
MRSRGKICSSRGRTCAQVRELVRMGSRARRPSYEITGSYQVTGQDLLLQKCTRVRAFLLRTPCTRACAQTSSRVTSSMSLEMRRASSNLDNLPERGNHGHDKHLDLAIMLRVSSVGYRTVGFRVSGFGFGARIWTALSRDAGGGGGEGGETCSR